MKHFKPRLWPSIIAFTVFCLLISLGFWQLYRYHYKKDLLNQYQSAVIAQPLSLSKINTLNDIRFQHIKTSGYYLNNKTMLLQHRFYNSKVGFEVLTPFRVKNDNKVVLVNRGWVPMQQNRKPPSINAVTGLQRITGYIKVLDKHHFILGKNILNTSQWPLKMQKVDFKKLSDLTQLRFYPFILRLDSNQPHGYIRKWQPINMTPARHLGYAIQWFAMALALLIAFFFFSRHKKHE